LSSIKGKRYVSLGSPDGDHHYVLIDWAPKPKKSLSEAEAKMISKKEASSLLFMVRE
jgi:hypothetical protein